MISALRNILRRLTRPIWRLFGYDAEFWRGPMLAGALVAAVIWIIWYYTKVPCTAALAADGVCNPGALANYINVDIASRCTAAWLGTTTLTGGINAVMLERERQRTEEANQRTVAAHQLADEANQRTVAAHQLTEEANQRNEEMRREAAEERRIYNERIQQLIDENREERRQSAAMQQTMLDTMAQMSATMDELRRHNGNGSNGAYTSGDQP